MKYAVIYEFSNAALDCSGAMVFPAETLEQAEAKFDEIASKEMDAVVLLGYSIMNSTEHELCVGIPEKYCENHTLVRIAKIIED
jgi:hypothetical protein